MLDALVSQILDIDKTKYKVEKLAKGLANDCFKISTSDKTYFLRVPGKNTDLHVNRQNESYNYKLATNIGLAPNLIYENSKGVVFREFLDGYCTNTFNQSELLQVANSFKILHSSKVTFANHTNYVDEIRFFSKIIIDNTGQLSSQYQDLLRKTDILEPILNQHLSTNAPCHNDLNPNNIVFKDNKAYFIDWEASSMGQAEWDLAYFITTSDLDSNSELEFFKAYYGDVTKADLYKVALYKPIAELIFAIWARMQLTLGNFPGEYSDMEEYEIASIQQALVYFEDLGI